tara:strand:+ start:922 stop:1044 length:123 start_codon:yes stop_codon:yes gene_type:complete
MFSGIFFFILRNARIAVAIGIVTAAVSAAGAVGWITAPIG